MVAYAIKEQYLNAGKRLTPLFGNKNIPGEDWPNKEIADDCILTSYRNLGWVLGENDLVVDVDPRNGGDKSYDKLLKNLKINLEPTVNTPRGGFHIYLKISNKYAGKQFKKSLNKDYPGIDFLTKGSYCLICGCKKNKSRYTWHDEMLGCFEQNPAPESLIDLLCYDSNNKSNENNDLGDFEGLIGRDYANWPKDKVLNMLSKLDPSMGNDQWVKVGMALHDWDPIEGLKLWENWSKDGDNYEEGQTEVRWRSFDLGGGVTLGTISHMSKEVDYDETISKVNNYIKEIDLCDEKQLEFELIPKLKKESFNKVNREKLVLSIQNKYKELSGIKMPVGNIRQMISNTDVVTGTFISNEEAPEWCKNWVYVNSHGGFIDLKTLFLHKAESFNVENGKYIPMAEGGTKPSATKYVADRGFVNKVDSMAYLPSYPDTICNIEGNTVLNCFNPRTIPKEAQEFTEQGKSAIKKIKKHIKLICTTEENAQIFTQWLAHQVQYPGRQILWSPVIQSIPGVGKSFFGELLRACLGDRNVGTVSPTQVVSEFNGWATNVVVNVLEELRVKGHNRYDAVNALKPLITDRMIQINDKGVKQFMTYNTTNYMCFTNYKDALPLDVSDRRWWVIFVPIQSLDDLVHHVGESASTYFPKLFNAVRNNREEIRKWLLDYNVSESFMNTKQAPMTEHKLSMIATEDATFEGLDELKELIKKGGKYFNEDVISSADLFDSMLFEYPEIDIQTTKKNILLKKLGYMAYPSPIKLDGKTRRVWTKKQLSSDEIRDILVKNN
jgi:hypothetical protein